MHAPPRDMVPLPIPYKNLEKSEIELREGIRLSGMSGMSDVRNFIF